MLSHIQGNGPVCQVQSSPEILLVYRVHVVMIVQRILAADTRVQGCEKNFPNLPSSGAVFHGAVLTVCVGQTLIRL
jgi:hypothetical protein